MLALLLSFFTFSGRMGRKECGIRSAITLGASFFVCFFLYTFSSAFLGILLSPECFVVFNEVYFNVCCSIFLVVAGTSILSIFCRRCHDVGMPLIGPFALILSHVLFVIWFYELPESYRICVPILLIGADCAIFLFPGAPKKNEYGNKLEEFTLQSIRM